MRTAVTLHNIRAVTKLRFRLERLLLTHLCRSNLSTSVRFEATLHSTDVLNLKTTFRDLFLVGIFEREGIFISKNFLSVAIVVRNPQQTEVKVID